MTRTFSPTDTRTRFEVIAPAPSVSELLTGSPLYNPHNLRITLAHPYQSPPDNVEDTELLAAAPFFVESGHWEDDTFVVDYTVGTFAVSGRYSGEGSTLIL